MRSLHVWDKQMKAVSPLLQQVINISSIVGSRHLDFLYLGLSGGCFTVRKPYRPFIQQAWGLGPPLFIFFLQDPTSRRSDYSGALTSVAGVFIYSHIIGTIYNYIGIVIGCAILFTSCVSMELPLFSRSSASAPMTSTSVG